MKDVFNVSLLLIISEVLSQIHLFLYSEKLSLRFEAVDQQKWLQSSGTKDPAWPSRDQIAFLLELTLLQDRSLS